MRTYTHAQRHTHAHTHALTVTRTHPPSSSQPAPPAHAAALVWYRADAAGLRADDCAPLLAAHAAAAAVQPVLVLDPREFAPGRCVRKRARARTHARLCANEYAHTRTGTCAAPRTR